MRYIMFKNIRMAGRGIVKQKVPQGYFRTECLPNARSFIRPYNSYDHSPPPGPFTATQSKILSAASSHIPKHGFTLTSLSLGANDAGYVDATTNLFPSGPFSLVYHHLYSQRLALKSSLGRPNQEIGGSVGSKVKALTWQRLNGNRDVIHRWPEAVAHMALPANIAVAMEELSLLVDEIWFLSGDTSVDTSWYTKRASLAAIYTSTELFMTTDKSLDFEATQNFLNRRFKDVQVVGSILGAMGQWGGFTASSMVNILRSRGVRI